MICGTLCPRNGTTERLKTSERVSMRVWAISGYDLDWKYAFTLRAYLSEEKAKEALEKEKADPKNKYRVFDIDEIELIE
jgi:hypothetical protein